MAKVKVTANIVDQYFPVIARVAATELVKVATDIGERLIKGKTRSGNQLVDNGQAQKQPPLSDSWKKRRAYLAGWNRTHPAFGPARSNLTFTGQLIDAVVTKSTKSGDNVRISFEVSDTARQPYKNSAGTPSQAQPTNKQLAGYLAEKARFFVGLDNKSRTQINNELTRVLRRKLKTLLR